VLLGGVAEVLVAAIEAVGALLNNAGGHAVGSIGTVGGVHAITAGHLLALAIVALEDGELGGVAEVGVTAVKAITAAADNAGRERCFGVVSAVGVLNTITAGDLLVTVVALKNLTLGRVALVLVAALEVLGARTLHAGWDLRAVNFVVGAVGFMEAITAEPLVRTVKAGEHVVRLLELFGVPPGLVAIIGIAALVAVKALAKKASRLASGVVCTVGLLKTVAAGLFLVIYIARKLVVLGRVAAILVAALVLVRAGANNAGGPVLGGVSTVGLDVSITTGLFLDATVALEDVVLVVMRRGDGHGGSSCQQGESNNGGYLHF